MIKLLLPSALAFTMGILYGGRIKFKGSILAIILAGIAVSLLLHSYPYYSIYYSSLPFSFSEIFLAAMLGVLYGSITRKTDEKHPTAG